MGLIWLLYHKGGLSPPLIIREKIEVYYADVLINLPTITLNQIFTYAIPERLKNEVSFGKRVLVEFGQKKIDAYVIAVKNKTSLKSVKNIIHVLDNTPIINNELLKIAYFMADNYLCPVSMALNAMVPKAITRSRAQVIIPMVEIDDFKVMPHLHKFTSFFKELWQKNEITLVNSKRYINDEDLDYLTSLGVIKTIHKYSHKPTQQKGYVYSLDMDPAEINISKLSKRAPRQAEMLEVLLEDDAPCVWLDKKFHKSTINALLNKGWITKKPVTTNFMESRFDLTAEQSKAVKTVNAAINKGKQEFLLFGVTGSGKTEVYINLAQYYIACGKTVLMLIPEIALTRHLVDVISLRISNIAVLHSNMSNSERLEEWERIKNGEVSFVLGTRSAVFAPMSNLGLIIIDEEQEGTYKQEETPKYDAREVARKRALYNNAVILYGSATPSLELFNRVQNREVFMLRLDSRIGDAKLPRVHIEDLKKGKMVSTNILSAYLQGQIINKLNNNEQIILFINRRGYSPITVCNQCGKTLTCPRCSVGLNYHQDLRANICHYCDYRMKQPRVCPECSSNHLIQIGIGTQKVEAEVKRLFPDAVVARLDLDVSRKGMQDKLLKDMKKRQIDILIGTQMVAKGLDFPNVSLVGIIDADSMLALPDYRAAERAFQLIVQAAGRAGRGEKLGEVVIQTYNPEAPIINWAAEQSYMSFAWEELKLRKILRYPPFTSLLRLVVSSEQQTKAMNKVEEITQFINEITDAKEDYLHILGPAPCPIEKIRNKYRYQIIIKSDNMLLLKSIGYYIIKEIKFPRGKIDIDINPNTML